VASLRRLLRPAAAPIEVEHRAMPATTTAAIRATVDHSEVLDWYDGAMAELDRTLQSLQSDANRAQRRAVRQRTVHRRTRRRRGVRAGRRPPSNGRVQPFVVPAAKLAITVHRGPHDDIDVSYGALDTYVTEHALVLAKPVHESYLVGPRDTDDTTAWRTKIGWPVFHTSTGGPTTTPTASSPELKTSTHTARCAWSRRPLMDRRV
jgi:effector-binding domain-containing protein